MGHRRVALGERGEVLVDHRLEQAGDDFLDRHAGLDQRVGVGLGEDAALGADLVQRIVRVYGICASRSGAICSLRAVFSMKVPVPPLHADCM